jgi:serine/threonine protein kinase
MRPELIGGRYRVLAPIGQGGMGTVWLCRDETLHREVAVKQVGLLPGESVTDSARALREARSSAALSHRNVVTVFDVVEDGASVWLVMEHVPSRSLQDLVRLEGPLPPEQVAEIGAQVADGLAAAHAAGTVHRDVKPGNVLVREDGTAKISDFGIARRVGDQTLTQSGFVTGTPSYFSPELARGAAPSAAGDVWALGATLYAAVEGHSPYQAQRNPVAVLHEIASSQPPRPSRADFLEPVLLRMMDREPESRWSMADAAHALRRLADQHAADGTRTNTVGMPVPAPAPPAHTSAAAAVSATRTSRPGTTGRSSGGRPQRRPERRRGRRRGPWAVLLVVAALLVAAAVGYAVLRDDTGGSGGTGTAGGSARGSTGAGPSTSAGSPDPSSTPSSSPSSTPSSSPSSTPSSSSSSSSTGSVTSGTAASQEAFLRSYYAAAPGGTDRAWSMLGPGEKAQGRARYDAFWQRIRSVDVTGVSPLDENSLEVRMTYHETNGEKSSERQRVDLIRSSDGGYLINNDDVLG